MTAVLGTSTTSTPAVKGENTGTGANAGRGVWGESDEHDGVAGYTSSSSRYAAYFKSLGGGPGVYAETAGNYKIAVEGAVSGYAAVGVYGESLNAEAGTGVWGQADAEEGVSYGLYGLGLGAFGTGVYAYGTEYGAEFDGAVEIAGSLNVTGSITKGGGGFLIDHPLDPSNRSLVHSFVESDERKNVYDGIAVADGNGEATVELPKYFESLNAEPRYQLTALGGPAPSLHIKAEIANGRFVIAGATPGQRISWQISGRRVDAWARANALVVEADKPQPGRYWHPALFGAPETKGVKWRKRPDPRRRTRPVDPRPTK